MSQVRGRTGSWRLRDSALVCLLAALLLSCAKPVVTERISSVGLFTPRIALVPIVPKPNAGGADPELRTRGAAVVTARLLEEVHDHSQLNSVPPPAVRRALEAADLAWPASGPEEIGALLARTFGVSGFLAGELLRYSERAGSARGSASPAAVAFTLGLYGADGRLIWRASFEEAQRSLMDDPGSLRRAWDRGFRWLTAEQIAAYGAREIVARLPAPGDAQ